MEQARAANYALHLLRGNQLPPVFGGDVSLVSAPGDGTLHAKLSVKVRIEGDVDETEKDGYLAMLADTIKEGLTQQLTPPEMVESLLPSLPEQAIPIVMAVAEIVAESTTQRAAASTGSGEAPRFQ